MSLTFKDIKNWKPSSISIVDTPSHPMAVFEVYENDEEFVKKFKKKGDKMTDTKLKKEGDVKMSESFFEKLFNGLIAKSAEPPITEPDKNQTITKADEDVKTILLRMEKKVDSIDSRVSKLEGKNPYKKEGEDEDPVPGAVTKSTNPEDDNSKKSTSEPDNNNLSIKNKAINTLTTSISNIVKKAKQIKKRL